MTGPLIDLAGTTLRPSLTGEAGEGGGEGCFGQKDSRSGQIETLDWAPYLVDCPKDPHIAKSPIRADQPLPPGFWRFACVLVLAVA
jgi:hypothetical protein